MRRSDKFAVGGNEGVTRQTDEEKGERERHLITGSALLKIEEERRIQEGGTSFPRQVGIEMMCPSRQCPTGQMD